MKKKISIFIPHSHVLNMTQMKTQEVVVSIMHKNTKKKMYLVGGIFLLS